MTKSSLVHKVTTYSYMSEDSASVNVALTQIILVFFYYIYQVND